MNVNENTFSIFETEFLEIAKNIQETQDEQKNIENEKLVTDAYNKIIRYLLPIWHGKNDILLNKIKPRLNAIYTKLSNCLKILKSETKSPSKFTEEIKVKERKQSQSTNEDKTSTEKENLLQISNTYNDDRFQELLDDFYKWDKKINRKNASEKPSIVEERTKNIIKTYNNIIEYAKPILLNDDSDITDKIKSDLQQIRGYIIDDLNILDPDIQVPDNFTEKIENPFESNDDDNSNLNDDKPSIPSTSKTNNDDDSTKTNPIPVPTNKTSDDKRTDLPIPEVKPHIDPPIPAIQPHIDPPNTDNKKKDDDSKSNKIDPVPKIKPHIEPPESNNKGDEQKKTDNTNDSTTTNEIKPNPIDLNSNKEKLIKMEEVKKLTNDLSKILTTVYNGDPNSLSAFIAAIELAEQITTDEQQKILVAYIKTKLQGTALEAIPEETETSREIILALRKKIKPETKQIVKGRLLALRAERTTMTKFQKEAEELADQLRRAYISDGIPPDVALKYTTEDMIKTCRLSAKTPLVKSVLSSKTFNDPKEVIVTLVTEGETEREETQILSYGRQNVQYKRNFRGNFNRRNFTSNNYRNGQKQFNNNNNSYGQKRQNNYRGNTRGNGNNRNWRQSNNNRRQSNGNRVYHLENSDAPPSGAETPTQQVQLRHM